MGALDSVLNEAGTQLGISRTSAGSVLSGLLMFMNQDAGGVTGFFDRFRRIGKDNLLASWLRGDAQAVSPDTVESAIGHDPIARIASRAGLTFASAASAIALMLPKLVERIAPGGILPARLSPDLASYMAAPAAAVSAATSAATSAARATGEVVTREVRGLRNSYWPLLAALAVVGLLALWLASRGPAGSRAFNAEEQVRLASERSAAALAALRPGFSARALVDALNLHVINFPTGSAQIPSTSFDFLRSAAAAFKNAPAGSIVEIGGHTDATGDAAANMALSQQRANAVRDYLIQLGTSPSMLVARGYGDTKPVVSNDSEEQRFRNRRIEFTVR
jgi:outer membrane protein OmpA-like peptidoglycan-associated protein/uncharacterized protein YidB (DUF937 family)